MSKYLEEEEEIHEFMIDHVITEIVETTGITETIEIIEIIVEICDHDQDQEIEIEIEIHNIMNEETEKIVLEEINHIVDQ